MIDLGITVDLEVKTSGNPPKYVEYTLPPGWKMVDDSWRADLPDYFIVDENDMKRVSVRGSWKEMYDNHLTISIVQKPEKLVRKNTPLIPSETDTTAVVCKFAEALDPLKRPAEPLVTHRTGDFVPAETQN